MIFNISVFLLSLFFALIAYVTFTKIPLLKSAIKGKIDNYKYRISIIIPARNEENNLKKLLASIRQQTMSAYEVIVVDDHSEDRTAATAFSFGAKVIKAPELPKNWLGKSWACWLGALKAEGNLLIFLDADVFLEKDALLRLVEIYEEKRGLISVQPFHFMEKNEEKLSAFFNLILSLNLSLSFLAKKILKPAGAYGPCLVCHRQDYFNVGGHQAVRDKILEDIALGRRFQEKGLSVHLYGGMDSLSFRMYPQGFWQLVEGWTKNFALGALSSNPLSLIFCLGYVTFCLSAPLNLIKGLIAPQRSMVIMNLIIYFIYAGQINFALSRLGNFGSFPALFYPVFLIFFILIFFRSLFYTYCLRNVTWKGRKINLAKRESKIKDFLLF